MEYNKNTASSEELMSTADAARYLGCSISALNYRGLSGYLGEITIENGRKRYSRSALDAFILKYGRSNTKRRTVTDEVTI